MKNKIVIILIAAFIIMICKKGGITMTLHEMIENFKRRAESNPNFQKMVETLKQRAAEEKETTKE